MKIKTLINKIIFIAICFIVIISIATPVFADMPDIPEDPYYHESAIISSEGYLAIIIVSTAFLLIPFFVLEFLAFKNQKLLETATDEGTIKKTKKYITTLSSWSTIFLTLWLLYGVYYFGATEYLDIVATAWVIIGFFALELLILLLKIINFLSFKKINGATAVQSFLILGFITYYLNLCQGLLKYTISAIFR